VVVAPRRRMESHGSKPLLSEANLTVGGKVSLLEAKLDHWKLSWWINDDGGKDFW
jgi:hypothetical protein